MKIAIVIHKFDVNKGGAERFAAELARMMISEEHDVHIYSNAFEEDIAGISSHHVKAVKMPRFLYELTFAENSSEALRKGGYDVVLGINRTLFQDILILPSATSTWYWQDLKSFKNPLLRHLRRLLSRTISPKYRIICSLEKKIYGDDRVWKIVANSNMVRDDIITSHNVPPDKVETVYHGVDLEAFDPHNRVRFRKETRASLGIGNEKIVLFVGHNFRLKGLHSFVQVISILKKRGASGFKGVVVGRGKREPYLREAEKLGCDDLLVFSGQLDDMRRIYAASDLLLQPTYYDACSLTTLEALASGLPVVTTRYNGAGELINDGQEGYVVDDPADVEKLAARVAILLNEEKLTSASAKARELAQHYPHDLNYKRILELCKEMAAERRGKWTEL